MIKVKYTESSRRGSLRFEAKIGERIASGDTLCELKADIALVMGGCSYTELSEQIEAHLALVPVETVPDLSGEQFTSEVGATDAYGVDAGALGWRPGFWPAAIEVDGVRALRRVSSATGCTYRTSAGVDYQIYND